MTTGPAAPSWSSGLCTGGSFSAAPAPVQVGKRWVVERTNSWLNDFGRLRRCTERGQSCVEAYLALATAIVTLRALLRAAWYPLPLGRPTTITTHPLTYWRTP